MNGKIAALCLTSRRSAYSDHFLSICHECDNYLEFESLTVVMSRAVVESSASLLPFLSRSDVKSIDYFSKDIYSVMAAILTSCRILRSTEKVFVYGENPVHAFICLILRLMRPKLVIVFKMADPRVHLGVGFIEETLFSLSKVILVHAAKKVLIADRRLLSSASKYLQNITTPKAKFVVFGNLVTLKIEATRAKLTPLSKRPIDILFFGRLEKYKGLDRFVSVTGLLGERRTGLTVVVVGGAKESTFKNSHIVHKKEYLSDKDFCKLLSSAKIGFFPYIEASGSHVVQNMNLFGGLVVASDVGYFGGAIDDNINGFLFNNNLPNEIIAQNISKYLDDIDNNKYDADFIRGFSIRKFDVGDFSREISLA